MEKTDIGSWIVLALMLAFAAWRILTRPVAEDKPRVYRYSELGMIEHTSSVPLDRAVVFPRSGNSYEQYGATVRGVRRNHVTFLDFTFPDKQTADAYMRDLANKL